jgi:hypothetical protein
LGERRGLSEVTVRLGVLMRQSGAEAIADSKRNGVERPSGSIFDVTPAE